MGSPLTAVTSDSSPRVRGALGGIAVDRSHQRLIPACAGSTATTPTASPTNSTHPRVCGEHGGHLVDPTGGADSSPRVRGAHDPEIAAWASNRLIPACAGSTSARHTSGSGSTTHPRVCGEHVGAPHIRQRLYDSSPRVRGARLRPYLARVGDRLIPACAGSTTASSSTRPRSSTHPRVCGEHWTLREDLCINDDSSPRVRGAPFQGRDAGRLRRLIPACAGSTCPRLGGGSFYATHPRVCGEHATRPSMTHVHNDSSPRVRGAPRAPNGLLP